MYKKLTSKTKASSPAKASSSGGPGSKLKSNKTKNLIKDIRGLKKRIAEKKRKAKLAKGIYEI